VSDPFSSHYGPWCVVAGASEGLGAAFAEALASRGLHLVLLARRAPLLSALASALTAKHGVQVRTVPCDLADESFVRALLGSTRDVEIGLGVYNAAYSFVGELLTHPLEDALRVVDVNVRGPLRFLHALAPSMIARRRGGLILMSSIAGFQGAPRLSAYAASKAFNIVLGESLWAELRPHGVDVLVSCAGAIRTPNYAAAMRKEAPGTLDPSDVAERTLRALGDGPMVVPGGINKLARFFLGRALSRRGAVSVMAKSTESLE
jgi:short-subunit dehydrogenase